MLRLEVSLLTGLFLILSAVSAAGAGSLPSCFEVLGRSEVPEGLQRARDIRFARADGVFVTVSDVGVVRLPLKQQAPDQTHERREVLVSEGEGRQEIYIPWELAASQRFLVVGSPVYELGWRRLDKTDAPGLLGKDGYDVLFDLDLRNGRLLTLGAKRGAKDRFLPEGAIAWLGSLESNLADQRVALRSTAGPGARAFSDCGLMDLGSVRFLANGSFLIIPHVEEGVYLYSEDGTLSRTWQAEVLGFDAGCRLSQAEGERLALDEAARWEWINRRRTVDEILPLSDGVGVVVRAVSDEGTSWQMTVLQDNGETRRCRLPFSSPSRLAHLRGDVRDDRAVLLLTVLSLPGKPPDTAPSILLVRAKE